VKPMEWVRLVAADQELSSHAVAVAYALAANCGKRGLVYWSNTTVEQLAQRTHLGRTSVKAGLAELVESEWIGKMPGPRAKGGRQGPNSYSLLRPQPVDNSGQGSRDDRWQGSQGDRWNRDARHNQRSQGDHPQVSTYKGYRKSPPLAVDNTPQPASQDADLETQLAATATRLTVARG